MKAAPFAEIDSEGKNEFGRTPCACHGGGIIIRRFPGLISCAIVLWFYMAARSSPAAVLPAGFAEEVVVSGLSSPSTLTFAPDGRLFIGQQDGTIRLVQDDELLPVPFATLRVDSTAERGLLGIAVDPAFPANPYVYVYYTAPAPVSHNRLSRLQVNGNVVVPGSEQVLLDLPPINGAIWHMGGAITFGPDGKIYIAVGDHLTPAAAPSLTSLFGKILRVNADGSIPSDNPFFNETTGLFRAIWAKGLRNPFTMAFDRDSGRLYINDVGQEAWEEINLGARGADYGWPGIEGPGSGSGLTPPIYAYPHSEGCAVTGGAFYDSAAKPFPPQYAGKYFLLDFCEGFLRVLDPATGQVTPFATGIAGNAVGLRCGPDGNLYYLSRFTNSLYRIAPAIAPRITLQPESQLISDNDAATFTASGFGVGSLSYQWLRDGMEIAGATSATYVLPSADLADDGAVFHFRASNAFGSVLSKPAVLRVTANEPPVVRLISPAIGTRYSGGDRILFSAAARDREDRELPASAFTWRVSLQHADHTHPFIAPMSGVKRGSFVIPHTAHGGEAIFYRITLTVQDTAGLRRTVVRDVHPRTARLTLATNPPGLQLALDGQPFTASKTFAGIAGTHQRLSAPSSQQLGGVDYQFAGWSDRGASSHAIAFPGADKTITAIYSPVTTLWLSDLEWIGSQVNAWGPVERDMSNGENAGGDGRRPLRIAAQTYEKGLGVHAHSEVRVAIPAGYARFRSDVGIDEETGEFGQVTFEVWADGVKLYDSGLVGNGSTPVPVDLDVSGRSELRLVVTDGGDGNGSDHADWGGARFVRGGALQAPAGPGGLTATMTETGAGLEWIDYADNESGFRVERSLDRIHFAQIGATAPDGTHFEDRSAPVGRALFYRVRSWNAAGASAPSNIARLDPARAPVAIGNYVGLISGAANALDSNGSLNLRVIVRRDFSALLKLGGGIHRIVGSFDGNGNFTRSIARPGLAPIALSLRLGSNDGVSEITGEISAGGAVLEILAGRVPAAGAQPRAAAARYTVLLPPVAQSGAPAGYGYAAMNITAARAVSMVGKMGDGTPFSFATMLGPDGAIPVHIELAGGTGALSGRVAFVNEPASDCSGELTWWRAGNGIPITLLGARYSAPNPGIAVLDVLPGPNNAALRFSGGSLSAPFERLLTLRSMVQFLGSGCSLRVNPASGVFSGSIATGEATRLFSGVIVRKQNRGAGVFIRDTAPGAVELVPR
jgi:glucose/arabinose dehydrogenase